MSDGSTPLKHHRMEAFAQGMASHGDRKRSVLEGGYQCAPKNVRQQARDLLGKPEVQTRIAYLNARTSQTGDETLGLEDEVLSSLRITRDKAEKDRDWSAMNRSNELIGRTQALFADRRVTEQADPFESMSSEQLEQTVAGFLRDPLLRGMVRRSLARYEDGDRQRPDDPEPEGGGSIH
jgi:hypothetical protein